MDDEVDEHHRSRDKISLDPDADSDDDDSFDDEGAGVMDIEADDDSDEEEDEEEDDSEEDDEDEDEDEDEDDANDSDAPAARRDSLSDDGEEEAALIKAMRAQQRRLDARGATRRTADDDDLDASATDSDDEAAGIRGRSKDDFYGDDDVDHEGQSDEEERADEEREARRLQRAAADGMDAGDFDAFSNSESDSSDSERKTLGAKARAAALGKKKGKKKGKKALIGELSGAVAPEGAAIESLGGDAVAAAASDAVASDAPELIALTKELTKNLDEVTHSVEPVIAAARAGELATAEGISYLDAKHLLMLSYCVNIVFYLLLKSEGRSVRDHPVVLRLVEIRAYLEKLRPIDRKLRYQIDKLLKTSAASELAGGEDDGEDEDDPLRFKPNPDALVGGADAEDAEALAGGAYRPPKMVPTAMDDFEEGGKSAKQKRKEKEARRRASRSALIKVRRFSRHSRRLRDAFFFRFFWTRGSVFPRERDACHSTSSFFGALSSATLFHGDRRRPFFVAQSARTKSWAGYRPPRRGRLSNQELDSLSFLFFSFPISSARSTFRRSFPRRALTVPHRLTPFPLHRTPLNLGTRARARRGSRGARRRRRRHVERVREARVRAHGGARENRGGPVHARPAFENRAAAGQGDDALDELAPKRGRLRGRRGGPGGGGGGAGGPEGQEAEAGGLGDARVGVGGAQKPKARLRRARRPAQGLARGTRPALFPFSFSPFPRAFRGGVSYFFSLFAFRIVRSVDDSPPWSLGVKNDAIRTHSLAEVRRARRVAAAGADTRRRAETPPNIALSFARDFSIASRILNRVSDPSRTSPSSSPRIRSRHRRTAATSTSAA